MKKGELLKLKEQTKVDMLVKILAEFYEKQILLATNGLVIKRKLNFLFFNENS